jgi:hypothetical protein
VAAPGFAASVLSLGPNSVQALVAQQLFNRAGRWYLMDEGGVCYAYLEAPHAQVETGRLVLAAHLVARIGQAVGSDCIGADFASNVTISGRLNGKDHELTLDDIRVDHADDEATRDALNMALQLSGQGTSRAVAIDVLEFLRTRALNSSESRVRLDRLHILNVATPGNAIVIEFDLSLSAP